MIVVLRADATQDQIDHIVERARELGLKSHISQGEERTIIGFIGPEDVIRTTPLDIFPGVETVMPVLAPYKLVSREFQHTASVVKVKDGVQFGGNRIMVMAGPCSIESHEGLRSIAREIKKAGATVLRGGAFKPRTSPYDFQGLQEEGLKYLAEVGKEFDLTTITEVMDYRDLDVVSRYADILQVGARNMQNFTLLKEIGKMKKPVMLKRGMSATIKEWLMSAEYILSNGNFSVILCERGIRTFETMTRNTLDINAVVVAKEVSHLPVVVDPSHGTGQWKWVSSVAKAAVAAGTDGLMIEVHDDPEKAFSDGSQSLLPVKFAKLMEELKRVAQAVSREI
jgi:3-deoxy-7-phosphoheptulonate synthase